MAISIGNSDAWGYDEYIHLTAEDYASVLQELEVDTSVMDWIESV